MHPVRNEGLCHLTLVVLASMLKAGQPLRIQVGLSHGDARKRGEKRLCNRNGALRGSTRRSLSVVRSGSM
jgi:hypothetical protein